MLTYYVAASLDGFIADIEGGVGWLDTVDEPGEDYGYNAFYKRVDALIMGGNTYEQVLTFGDWPYQEKTSWIMTSRIFRPQRDGVIITAESPQVITKNISQLGHSTIWLVGGGKLAGSFHNAGLIDEYVISVAPIVLGIGLPLFGERASPQNLELVNSTRFPRGLMQLTYHRAS